MAMSSPPNFDRVAHIYRWAEYLTLGPLLQKIRTHFLPQLNASRNALIFGDGAGRFTEKLLNTNAHVHVKAVDISTSMLSQLRKRCAANATRLTTEHASAIAVEIPPATDLIVTHFFLDCLTQDEVNQLTASISQRCAPGTLWLLSDFAVPANWLAVPSRIYIRSLYFAFRLLTNLRVQQLPDPQSALTRAGFSRIERYTLLGGLIYTEIWRRA
jgi:SAM-dependent methyltransferase